MDLIKTFFFLFAVIDPIGAIPIFLEATKQFDDKKKRKSPSNQLSSLLVC
jgi:multiple antibiotic resistance protein